MKNLNSPVDIEVLLYHYYSPDPHPDRMSNVAVQYSINKFRENGIFTSQIQPELTPKGKAFVKCILNTPYPKQAYIDMNKNIISIEE
jgi:hypothetical protein